MTIMVWGTLMEQLLGFLRDQKPSGQVVILLIALCWAAYAWADSEYMSKQAGAAIVTKLDNHIVDSTLYRLDRDIQDLNDEIWKLEEMMLEPSGNTPARRQKLSEYKARQHKLEITQTCVHDNKNDTGVCFPGHR